MPRTESRDVYASASTRHTRPLTTAAAPGDWNWRARNNASPELNAEIEFPFLKRHEGFSLLFQRWILPEVRGRQRKANRRVRKHQLSAPHVASEGRRDKCCKLLHLSDVGWGQIYEKPHVSIPQKQCSDEKVVPKLVDGRKNLGTDFFFPNHSSRFWRPNELSSNVILVQVVWPRKNTNASKISPFSICKMVLCHLYHGWLWTSNFTYIYNHTLINI